MKTIDYYDSLPYKMVINPDADEGGYVVSYPDLPGCITCADSLNEAIENAKDAKHRWLEAALADNVDIHEPGTNSRKPHQ